jgi:hypothetical protein
MDVWDINEPPPFTASFWNDSSVPLTLPAFTPLTEKSAPEDFV